MPGQGFESADFSGGLKWRLSREKATFQRLGPRSILFAHHPPLGVTDHQLRVHVWHALPCLCIIERFGKAAKGLVAATIAVLISTHVRGAPL